MSRSAIVKSKTVLFDDFFKIEEAVLQFQMRDGTMSRDVRRLSFERGDSVAVLIYNAATQLLTLVKQFKYPTLSKGPGWIIETTAGMIDHGESAEAAARREVLEEVGYAPSRLEPISTFYVSPGGSSERIILYYAQVDAAERVADGGGLASEDEDIETVELTLDQALELVGNGGICDAKTILAIYWFRNYIAQASARSEESG